MIESISKVGLHFSLKSQTMTVAMYKVIIIVIVIVIVIVMNVMNVMIKGVTVPLLIIMMMQIRLLPTDNTSGLYLKTELKRGKRTVVSRFSISISIILHHTYYERTVVSRSIFSTISSRSGFDLHFEEHPQHDANQDL